MTMIERSSGASATYPDGYPYDGELLERTGGRRWFIMRTGGQWLRRRRSWRCGSSKRRKADSRISRRRNQRPPPRRSATHCMKAPLDGGNERSHVEFMLLIAVTERRSG